MVPLLNHMKPIHILHPISHCITSGMLRFDSQFSYIWINNWRGWKLSAPSCISIWIRNAIETASVLYPQNIHAITAAQALWFGCRGCPKQRQGIRMRWMSKCTCWRWYGYCLCCRTQLISRTSVRLFKLPPTFVCCIINNCEEFFLSLLPITHDNPCSDTEILFAQLANPLNRPVSRTKVHEDGYIFACCFLRSLFILSFYVCLRLKSTSSSGISC